MKNITGSLFTIILFMAVFSVAIAQNSDIEIIRQRVFTELMKPKVEETKVSELVATIKEDGTWPGIDYSNVSREGFEHRYHSGNMVILARAYKSKSSKHYKKKKIKATINLALKNWVENDYFCDNWWYNQIGTPNSLVTLMMLVGDELDKTLVDKAQPIIGRAHTEAPGARPGGDRIKIAGIQAKNCLFLGQDQKFNEVVRIIESEIKYSEWVGAKYGYGFRHIPTGFSNRKMGGRGIQYDNSFHHRVDGVNNTLSYGLSYAQAFAEWAAYTTGTEFEFSEEKLAQLIDYFLDGVCKTAVFGKYPDVGAKNRSISREGALKAYNSMLPEKLIHVSDYRKEELQEIIDIRTKGKKPTLAFATYFWHSEHFTFQRPDWFASVRMYSTRTHNMESPYNSEGFLNHHRGDGANHLAVTGTEYKDMATVFDYQKIPGTTVMQKPEMPPSNELQKLGITEFVGAATDGKYGTVAFDFRSPHDPLIARKSWFFFDDEYVCLGTGISSKNNDLTVVTTLNQSLLRGDVTVSSEGSATVLEKGEKQLENIDWVYQDNVGYVFPQSAVVSIKNEQATGSWWRINKQTDSPKDEIKLDVFKLWVDHGKRPSEQTYEYIVVPATSIKELEQNSSKNNIKILSNTPELQAVSHTGLNICEAVFYKAGEVQVTEDIKLISDGPGIVIIKTDGQKIVEISASDPNRVMRRMSFSVSSKIEKKGQGYQSTWNEVQGRSEIYLDLPQGNYSGKSVTINLK